MYELRLLKIILMNIQLRIYWAHNTQVRSAKSADCNMNNTNYMWQSTMIYNNYQPIEWMIEQIYLWKYDSIINRMKHEFMI